MRARRGSVGRLDPFQKDSRWCSCSMSVACSTLPSYSMQPSRKWSTACQGTHGARKNCSSTTYMPRNSSVMRKYLPALSSEDSSPSSHRFGLGRRKPFGGAPGKGASCRVEVENAVAVGCKTVLAGKSFPLKHGLEHARDTALNCRMAAMLVEWRRCEVAEVEVLTFAPMWSFDWAKL